MKFQELSVGVFIVRDFMTEIECQNWIDFSEKRGYEDAKVNIGGASQVVNI